MVITLLAFLTGCGGKSEEKAPPPVGLFGYRPDTPLEPEETNVAQWPGSDTTAATTQAVSYVGGIDRVHGLLALPYANAPVPCVLFLPGFGNNKEGAWPLVGPLAEAGIGLLAIDHPAPVSSVDDPAARDAVLRSPSRYADLLRQAVVNARRGLDYLGTRPECDPDRLGVMGFSFGALAGGPLAAVDHRVRSSILMSIGAGFMGELTSPIGFKLPSGAQRERAIQAGLEVLEPLDPVRWVPRVAPRPVLLVSGTHDEVFSVAEQRALHRAAGRNSEVLWYEGGHNVFVADDQEHLGAGVLDFLQRTLVDAAP